MKKLLLLCLLLIAFLATGCAQSRMMSKKTLPDGTVIKYEFAINSYGQDFSGSDLAATLDPEGKTKIKAGAVDNTTSAITADVAASMVELVRLILPYITAAPVVAP